HGKGKAAAVRAAIHGGLIDVLIVDPDLGRSLLT
ncbi:MAG: sugar-binding transcriptional regulator, partial [Actinomycetia bacterium]|nr:sugar-binding transcriptional regulator [Actinomycetes bacterium]